MTNSMKTLAATAIITTIAFSGQANALPFSVKMACASDYYAYCSKHAPGSAGSRSCMRRNGSNLSKRCVKALIGAGLVSKRYVAQRRASR